MAKKGNKGRKRKSKKSFVQINTKHYFDRGKYVKQIGETGSNAFIRKALHDQSPVSDILTLPEIYNLDVISGVALHELKCQEYYISDKIVARVDFIASMVAEKLQGWQPRETPTTNNQWANEQDRFFLAYLSSCRMDTKRRICLLKTWLLKDTLGNFSFVADKGRRSLLQEMGVSLTHSMRESGVAQIVTSTPNQFTDTFNQMLFYAFHSAPVVIIQAVTKRQQRFHPSVSIAAYDEQYFDFDGFSNDVSQKLSGRVEQFGTEITALEPAIRTETFITGRNNFSTLLAGVDEWYTPLAC